MGLTQDEYEDILTPLLSPNVWHPVSSWTSEVSPKLSVVVAAPKVTPVRMDETTEESHQLKVVLLLA